MGKKPVSLEDIKNLLEEFTESNKELLEEIDLIIGVSRGGLIPAALLAAKINKPLAAAYIDKQDEIFFDRPEWIKSKRVLVVDDIIRSGKTLWLLKACLEKTANPAHLSFFTLFKVRPLANNNYNLPVLAQESDTDIVFPWDYDRQ